MVSIDIKMGEQILTLGMIGGGKSVLMKYLWSISKNRGVWVDFKRSAEDELYNFCHLSTCRLDVLVTALRMGLKVHWIGDPSDTRGAFGAYEILQNASYVSYTLKNCIIAADEVGLAYMGNKSQVAQKTDYWVQAIITGRSDQISVWGASQRNQLIPNVLITQANKIFMFKLGKTDLEYYKKVFPWIIEADTYLSRDKHNFIMYDQHNDNLVGPINAISMPNKLRNISYNSMINECKISLSEIQGAISL